MSKKVALVPLDLAQLTIQPLTQQTWAAFENLFGENGACGGCWCMFWHMKRSEFDSSKGEGNHQMMADRVSRGEVPGLLAFLGEQAVGWVAVEPRSAYQALERSRSLAPVDELPIWSIPCFFVDKRYRKQGLTTWLIREAARYAINQGAPAVEAYPVVYEGGKASDTFYYTGKISAFEKAGFTEVARPSKTKSIMRYHK